MHESDSQQQRGQIAANLNAEHELELCLPE